MGFLDFVARYDPEKVASAISNSLLVLLAISFVFLLQDRLRSAPAKKAPPPESLQPSVVDDIEEIKMPLS
jgi:hypothetical protein